MVGLPSVYSCCIIGFVLNLVFVLYSHRLNIDLASHGSGQGSFETSSKTEYSSAESRDEFSLRRVNPILIMLNNF